MMVGFGMMQMERTEYSLLNKLTHGVAKSWLGAWFFSRILYRLDKFTYKISGKRFTLGGVLSGLPIVVLTTIGAKSGQKRDAPLLGIRDVEHPERFALIASNWGQARNPGWYYNLKANPTATCVIAGIPNSYHAHEATDAEYNYFWAVASKQYAGFAIYKERASHRHIPIMVLMPAETQLS